MLKPIVLGAGMALFLAACAQLPTQTREVAAPPGAQAQSNCLSTGTRVPLKPGQCALMPGRVYSAEDIQRTGAFDVAGALRQLDPAIQ